jgi:uncharacterized protein (TIGR02246 family)
MTVAEVNAVDQAFHEGVAKRDAAGLASLYADNGTFMPPGVPPREGRSEIQSAMQELLDMGARTLDLEPLDVRDTDNMTIEYGRYTLGIEPGSGPPVTEVGKYLVVHERQPDGSTKIVYDIFNSNSLPG